MRQVNKHTLTTHKMCNLMVHRYLPMTSLKFGRRGRDRMVVGCTTNLHECLSSLTIASSNLLMVRCT